MNKKEEIVNKRIVDKKAKSVKRKMKIKNRKTMVSIFLTVENIDFLDGKVDFVTPNRKSRSAIIRHLITMAQKKKLI